jgi:Fic family protein
MANRPVKFDLSEHIHNSNLIEGYDDLRADQMSEAAWAWLIRQPELTHDVIQKLQKRITLFQTDLMPDQRGYYRDMSKVSVWVGEHIASPWWVIKGLMDNWLRDYAGREPRFNHVAFEKIHPFCDGNGRTGRMLMWWQEIRMGRPPTLIKFEDREDYYDWFA